MPGFENVSQEIDQLRSWKEFRPRALELVDTPEAATNFGERHGSWVYSIRWDADGLRKSAEIALTNPGPTSDDTATVAVVSVYSSASDQARYVREVIYERQRAVRGVRPQMFEDWLLSAVRRANEYTPASLVASYETGQQ